MNDVPALQAADVGIAMGERGTRSAREVASIVLLDDDFSSIVRAIAEGRQLLVNLRLAFRYLMLIHVPFVVSAAWIPLLGHPLPFLPVHIVWLELVIHPSAMLAFQEAAPGGGFPRVRSRARGAFFSRGDWVLIAALGSLLTVLVVAGFERGLAQDTAHARSFALAILVCASAGLSTALSRLRTNAARLSSRRPCSPRSRCSRPRRSRRPSTFRRYPDPTAASRSRPRSSPPRRSWQPRRSPARAIAGAPGPRPSRRRAGPRDGDRLRFRRRGA